MRSLLALALILWTGVFLRPLVRRWLALERLDAATITCAAGGLGLGLTTLMTFWVMLVAPGAPAFALALAASVAIAAASWIAERRQPPDDNATPGPLTAAGASWPATPLAYAVRAGIVLTSAGIVFTAVSWPFDVGDALALYAPWAKHLYATRTLPVGDRLHEAYPMLLPIAYAWTHWAAGGLNEYVARLVPALMAIGVVIVTGLLGRAVGSARTALWAAGLVALTPIFGRWASTGYTDIPAAFYVGLTVLFAWRWWLTGSGRAMAAAGLCAGLAAWTKNSTLTLVPSLAVMLVTFPIVNRSWPARERAPSRTIGRAIAMCAGMFLLVAGPWYLRNQLLFGFIVPPTMLADRVDHTLGALVIMLRPDQSFGPSGLLFTLAPLAAIVALRRRRDRTAAAWYVLLLFLLPFVAAWWWLASYEARFLLAVIPVFAVMGALALDAATDRISPLVSPGVRRAVLHVALVVVVITTAIAWRRTVMYKSVLVQRPWLSDTERHQVTLGGLYDLALAVNGMPAGSRVGGVPAIMRYHLADERLPLISSSPETMPPERLQDRYDAVVYRLPAGRPLPWATSAPLLLRTPDGYLLFGTRPSSSGQTP